MRQALYRKWRPKTFEEVCGQEHITAVLRHEIQNDSYTHAYLFCGSRGTGKTTCAKLLAKAVNCLSPVNGSPCGQCEACRAIDQGTTSDVLEMDAASNTGVDYIRDIREAVMYAPSMLKSRVYIIDEVHMLSQSAFNALLKTLEEPPSSVVFILATTEQQKIPATILSRCQRFEFRRISATVIADRLTHIAKEEGINLLPDGAQTIARLSDGGMRDAISLLELCAGNDGSGNSAGIDAAAVRSIAGSSGRDVAVELVASIQNKDIDAIFSAIDTVCSSAGDLTVFWQDIMDVYRDMLVIRTTKDSKRYLDLTNEEAELLKELAGTFSGQKLLRHCSLLEDAFILMQRSNASKRLCAEMTLVKMCDDKLDTLPEGIANRVSAIEEKLATGNFVAPKPGETVSFKKTVAPDEKAKKDAEKEKTAPPPPAIKPTRTGLRPVPWWAEAIKRLEPSTASFFHLAKAYIDGNKIIVRANGSFNVMMMDTPAMREKLSELSAVFAPDRMCLPSDFEFIDIRGTDDAKFSAADELMQSLEEND